MNPFRRLAATYASTKIKHALSVYFSGFNSDTFGESVEAGSVLLTNLNLKTELFENKFDGIILTKGILFLQIFDLLYTLVLFFFRNYWITESFR